MKLLPALLLACIFSGALNAAEVTPPPAELPPVVYVPFDQAQTLVANPQGQGVFLPYEKFIKLWDAANIKPPDEKPIEPPVAAALAGFTLTGQVRGEIAELKIEATITALAKNWSSVALPAELALTGFQPGDKRVVLERGKNGLAVHLPEPGNYSFKADLAVPVVRDATGKHTLTLVLPSAAAGRLDLFIPGSEADVAVEPLVAATTVKDKTGTRFMAVLGGAKLLKVAWQPPVKETAGEALVLATSDLRLSVADRSLRYDFVAGLTILRRAVTELTVNIPPETQILAVEAKSLKTWEKVGNTVVLRLHEPVEGDLPVTLRLERLLAAAAPGESRKLDVLWPAVAGASRSTGILAISQGEGLAVAVDRAEGLSQVDPGELGDSEAGLVAAYRFQAPPPPTSITITRLQPELRAAIHQLVRLGVEEDLIAVVVQVDVRKAGVFGLACVVPANWDLVEYTGMPVDDMRPGQAVNGVRRLEFTLKNRLLGNGELTLRFKAPPTIPREAKVGETKASIPVAVLQVLDARQVRGGLAVAAPRGWALATAERTGLTNAEIEPLRRDSALAVLARELKADEDLPLGFTFLVPGAGVTLTATPRSRELAIQQEELVTVAEGHIKRLVTWRGEVRYSAAPVLRLQAPTALDDKLVFKGAALAEHVAAARADGVTTWELRFQSPVLGNFVVTAEATEDLPALVAGTPKQLVIGAMKVLDATRTQSLQAVSHEGTVEVEATAAGLEAVAPADLPPGLQGQGVVAGFRGAVPMAIDLSLVRHDLVQLADGSVTAVRYLAVVGEDDVVRVRGELVLTTRGRPYLELRLPQGAQLLEVAIDHRQGNPSRRPDGGVVVPLGDGTGLRRQSVGFIYELKLGAGKLGRMGSITMELPRFGADAQAKPLPVGQVDLAFYLPEPLTAYGWSGDFHPVRRPTTAWTRLASPHGGYGYDAASKNPISDPPSEDGLTVRIAPIGVRYDLARLGDGGTLSLRYIGRGWLMGLALALAVAGGLAVWASRCCARGVSGLVLVAVVASLAVAGPWRGPVAGFGLGVAVGVIVLLAFVAVHGFCAWRACRRSLAPDPWLEGKKPAAKSAKPAPVAAPPAAPAPTGAPEAPKPTTPPVDEKKDGKKP